MRNPKATSVISPKFRRNRRHGRTPTVTTPVVEKDTDVDCTTQDEQLEHDVPETALLTTDEVEMRIMGIQNQSCLQCLQNRKSR